MLKKARKIANGNDNANIPLGAFVDSLVIHPDDLVQVIAKVGLMCLNMLTNFPAKRKGILTDCLLVDASTFQDFSLHTKDVCRTPVCDTVAASAYVKPQTSHVNVFPLKYILDSPIIG